MTEDILPAAALAYADAGWQVFPLSARGGRKAPLFPSPHKPGHGCRGECGQLGHGFYDATSNPDTVAAWWERYPHALIGARIAHHLLVLDVDPHGGGEDTLQELQDTYHLPVTLTCYSGRGDGGRHLYYQRPPTPGWRLSGRRLRPGVDLIHHTLRYTVLPPSPHPKTGRPYWWDDPTIAPASPPAWLTAILTPRRPRRMPNTARATDAGVDRLVDYVKRLSPKERSGRHDAVLWALCRAVEDGASDTDIEAICRAAETIGKPRAEINAMRDWAATNAAAGRVAS